MNPNRYLSRHCDNDDPRHWTFVRNARIPRREFETRSDTIADRIMVVLAIVCIVAFFVGRRMGWL